MKQIFRISLYLVILCVLVAGLVWAHIYVRVAWKDAAFRQALLQDIPAQTSRTSALKKDLDSALASLQAIHVTIPQTDGLVEVVSAISAAAVSSGISAQVPVVQSNAPVQSPAPEGVFADVRIHVVASGNPAALASFLYRVEHLPYMLRVVSFKIDTTHQTAITSFSSEAPASSVQSPPLLGSSLEADIAIVTRKK